MQAPSDKLIFLGRLTAGVAVMVVLAWVAELVRELWPIHRDSYALDVDFSVFWAAARLALEDKPVAAFDPVVLAQARNLAPGTPTFPMIWFYPPGWLAVLLPFGQLPFFWAWLLFVAITFALFAWTIRDPARSIPGLWPVLLASPAVLLTMAIGQNSLLFAAAFVGAMEAIRRDRAILAGALLAFMTLKPQLGLAIPFVLLAGGYWRVILWGAGWTALIVAASALWPGLDYWGYFVAGLGDTADVIRNTILPRMMLTPYAFATVLGIEHDTALLIHLAIAIPIIALVAWCWSTGMSFDRKLAALAFATVLVTPYALYYESVFVLVGVLYLARASLLVGRGALLVAGALWIAPAVGIALLSGPGFAPIIPLIFVGLFLAVSQMRDAARVGSA